MIIVKKPKIRFKGFTETWEQRKLSEIYSFIGNAFVGTATPYYINEGHLYLESNNIKNGQINLNTKVFINDEFYEKQNDKWLHTGDIVMVQSGHVGHAAVIPKELNNSAAHALIMFRYPIMEVEPYFLNCYYQTRVFKRKIEEIATGNTIKHILASDMKELKVNFTNYVEQQKIGSLFSKLDNLITLHQRKCENLKKLKKFMLQKLFPQNGENVPKIRFSNFTDTWEQRKFKNIAERLSESYMSDDKNPSVEYEDIISELGTINKDIFNKRIRKNGIKFSNNEILYGKLRPYLHNWLKPDFNGIAVGDWWVLKPINCDREFIFRLIQTSTFDNIANQSNGTKMPRADWNLIANSDFYLPISIYEQKQIGSLFSKLDHLITLHQSKCDKLKEVKKYMLQNMFI